MDAMFFLWTYLAICTVAAVLVATAEDLPALRRPLFLIGLAVVTPPLAVAIHTGVGLLMHTVESVYFLVASVLTPAAFALGAFEAATALRRHARQRDLRRFLVLAGASVAFAAVSVVLSFVLQIVYGTENDRLVPLVWDVTERVAAIGLSAAVVGGVLASIVDRPPHPATFVFRREVVVERARSRAA